jgi:hypothetical protein
MAFPASLHVARLRRCTTMFNSRQILAFAPWRDVRFGSLTDICSAKGHVRFALNSDRESGFPQQAMSALPLKADMCGALAHVCFGPIADISRSSQVVEPGDTARRGMSRTHNSRLSSVEGANRNWSSCTRIGTCLITCHRKSSRQTKATSADASISRGRPPVPAEGASLGDRASNSIMRLNRQQVDLGPTWLQQEVDRPCLLQTRHCQ